MNSSLLRNMLRFLVLIALQVLVLNRVHLFGFLNPYLYVLFILLLPFETPRWLLLLSSFLLGLLVDSFANSYGLHTASATLMAFVRPVVLRLLTSRKEYEPGLQPGIRDLGINWFLSYAGISIFVHHFALCFLEAFRMSEFFPTLFRAVLNTILTLGLVVLAQYLFQRPRK